MDLETQEEADSVRNWINSKVLNYSQQKKHLIYPFNLLRSHRSKKGTMSSLFNLFGRIIICIDNNDDITMDILELTNLNSDELV